MELKMPTPRPRKWTGRLAFSQAARLRQGWTGGAVRFGQGPREPAILHGIFLINHPLDCPVCDKSGECYLQDYSLSFAMPTAGWSKPRTKTPRRTRQQDSLYQDRCDQCSRCVRFCDEVSGTTSFASQPRQPAEIDVFPGIPWRMRFRKCRRRLPRGVVARQRFPDEQRVWFLKETPSICRIAPRAAQSKSPNENTVWRLKPRYNPGVNDWWMCDEGRFGWKYVHDPKRLDRLTVRRARRTELPDWSQLPEIARFDWPRSSRPTARRRRARCFRHG